MKTKLKLCTSLLIISFYGCANTSKMEEIVKTATEKEYSLEKLEEAKSIQILSYEMPYVTGKTQKATALVFYPKTPKPEKGYSIVVWTHGTLGVGDTCAPSRNMLNENFKVAAKALLAQGYVIVAPDYEGLGSPGVHPYLNLKSEALSAIKSVNALKEKNSEMFNGKWMCFGQSQGGQAALGVAQYANTDENFKGTVAGAPASNLDKIILEIAPKAIAQIEEKESKNPTAIDFDKRISVFAQASLLTYATFASSGIVALNPNFDRTRIFKNRAKEIAALGLEDDLENGKCLIDIRQAFIDDIVKYLKENPEHKVSTYPGIDFNEFKKNTTIVQFIKDSQPGTQKIDKPVLIIQGKADTSVPYIVTENLVKNLKALGSKNIELLLVDNATHSEAIVKKNAELIAFINKYLPAK